jgi:hypothetical protein
MFDGHTIFTLFSEPLIGGCPHTDVRFCHFYNHYTVVNHLKSMLDKAFPISHMDG